LDGEWVNWVSEHPEEGFSAEKLEFPTSSKSSEPLAQGQRPIERAVVRVFEHQPPKLHTREDDRRRIGFKRGALSLLILDEDIAR